MEESAVHTASFAGNYKILDILLDQEPSAVNRPRICLGYYTPLHLAVLGGHVEAVAVILRHMPELEILDHTNRTAVHLAMECMLPEDHILRSTLAYQLRKTHCSPPITAEGDLPEIFHMLLDARANIDAKGTEDGLTCLHIACMYGINCAARSLIEHGADVGAASNIGFTPLHCAVVASDQSTVIQLLSVGANIHAVAEDIGTACALAYKTWGNASNTEENSLKERKRKCFEALDACHRAARVGPYTAVNLIEGGGWVYTDLPFSLCAPYVRERTRTELSGWAAKETTEQKAVFQALYKGSGLASNGDIVPLRTICGPKASHHGLRPIRIRVLGYLVSRRSTRHMAAEILCWV